MCPQANLMEAMSQKVSLIPDTLVCMDLKKLTSTDMTLAWVGNTLYWKM